MADVYATGPIVLASIHPLILVTCLLVGAQPRISALLRARNGGRDGERRHMSPATTAFATLTGVYGGYVGARIDRKLPDAVFRWAVVAAGVVAAVLML